MNPATPGPLTVLLVPPEGDTALIEGGVCRSRPPLMFRRHGPYSDDDRRLGLDRWSPLGDRASDVDCALVLVHEGTPVAMGCDRLARSMNVLPYGAYTEAWAHTMGRAYAGEHPGARVVLLRDGREVPNV